ncbi:MAG: RidA family protein [Ignavibacteriales bacterium]|nr:RidA family protein [Ignavibacteriales bacterium]
MIEDKLIELGLQLPIAPIPLASYVPAVVVDNLIFTSGQIPVLEGELKFKGKIGKDLTEEEGRSAAELCVLNCLSVIKNSAGSLDNIEKIIKVTVFINSADNFTGQPKVANGASDLLVKLFGEKGKHARSAVGVNELPINAAVEIEMIARLAG